MYNYLLTHPFSTGFLLLALAGLLATALHWLIKQIQRVPEDFVGFDGKRIYEPGKYLSPFKIQLIDTTPQLYIYGDSLQTSEATHTYRKEHVTDSNYVKGGVINKSAEEHTTKRVPLNRRKLVIMWKPDTSTPERIRTFLKKPTEKTLTELISNLPEIDLKQYETYLGIEILSYEGPKEKKRDSIYLSEDLELPYEG